MFYALPRYLTKPVRREFPKHISELSFFEKPCFS